jgi:hypothetical protein
MLGMAFFSYLYGLVPGSVAGFFSGLLVRLNGFLFCAFCGAISSLSAYVFYWLVAEPYLFSSETALYGMAVPGFSAGLFCGLVAFFAYKMADNSFNPTTGVGPDTSNQPGPAAG